MALSPSDNGAQYSKKRFGLPRPKHSFRRLPNKPTLALSAIAKIDVPAVNADDVDLDCFPDVR